MPEAEFLLSVSSPLVVTNRIELSAVSQDLAPLSCLLRPRGAGILFPSAFLLILLMNSNEPESPDAGVIFTACQAPFLIPIFGSFLRQIRKSSSFPSEGKLHVGILRNRYCRELLECFSHIGFVDSINPVDFPIDPNSPFGKKFQRCSVFFSLPGVAEYPRGCGIHTPIVDLESSIETYYKTRPPPRIHSFLSRVRDPIRNELDDLREEIEKEEELAESRNREVESHRAVVRIQRQIGQTGVGEVLDQLVNEPMRQLNTELEKWRMQTVFEKQIRAGRAEFRTMNSFPSSPTKTNERVCCLTPSVVFVGSGVLEVVFEPSTPEEEQDALLRMRKGTRSCVLPDSIAYFTETRLRNRELVCVIVTQENLRSVGDEEEEGGEQ